MKSTRSAAMVELRTRPAIERVGVGHPRPTAASNILYAFPHSLDRRAGCAAHKSGSVRGVPGNRGPYSATPARAASRARGVVRRRSSTGEHPPTTKPEPRAGSGRGSGLRGRRVLQRHLTGRRDGGTARAALSKRGPGVSPAGALPHATGSRFQHARRDSNPRPVD